MSNCKKCLSEQVCRYNDGINLYCKENYECPHHKTADVVEVVRCKDCEHYCANYCTRDIKGRTNMFYMNVDDFCSYGERKTDNDL